MLSQISEVYQAIMTIDDENTRNKLLQLYEKVKSQRLSISFCGHFSAGKSSLLNHMIDDRILPASPIPTSGNLVKLRAGEEKAILHLTGGERVAVPAPYSLDDFQAFSKNTALVETIEVYLGDKIHQNVELIDTPGVDSTDEAHQRLTEDALHLADSVMYVTDYNHVQSTVNFHFMQHLQELNKPYSLVINQVDKHQNKELSFQSFKDRVDESLRDWGLSPEKIYYTTLMEGYEDLNDLDQWLNDMGRWLNGQFDHLASNTTDALASVVAEYNQKLSHDYQSFLEDKGLSAEPEEHVLEIARQQHHDQKSKLNQLLEKDVAFVSVMTEQAAKAVSSSILMPYETREIGRSYLESLSPDFKMGLFTSQKKIEKERENRLNLFYEAFQKNSQTMEWNTRDQLIKTAKNEFGLQEEELNTVYELAIKSTPEDLTQNVKNGAQATGQYVLTYTENISDHFKKQMKRQALDWIEGMAKQYARKTASEKQILTAELKKLEDEINRLSDVLAKRAQLNEQKETVLNLLKHRSYSDREAAELTNQLEEAYQIKEAAAPLLTLEEALQALQKLNKEAENANYIEETNNTETASPENITQSDSDKETLWADTLEEASRILSPLNEYAEQAEQLKKRAARIHNNEMTLALFGAFSAGKTSFANALLGEQVLPVSPNPTTAVISQIRASTESFGHKKVQVKLKSAAQLLNDVQESLTLFNEKIDQFKDLPALLSKIKTKDQSAEIKLHYAFLQAVTAGLDELLPSIGTTLVMNLDDAHDMIANEVKSCFIEHATIYYDAPLTKQGIVLVDTPGADSINARHTDVAFNYIKNADAILFVTYYNHAFSRADREFLIQLGRVKDTFSMDKMFFIVNAADLAETADEEQQVIQYISSQLLTFGIRQPRLFGVSSKLALMRNSLRENRLTPEEQQALAVFSSRRELNEHLSEADLYQKSGLQDFESSLKSFVVNDLLKQTAQTGFKEIERVTYRLKETVRNLSLNETERMEKKNEYDKKLDDIKLTLSKESGKTGETAILQAIDEWFYYVKKRIILRYLDEFSAYINPSQFQDKSANQEAILLNQIDQLIAFLSYDLDQEMRATYLRIEAAIRKNLQQQGLHLQQLINDYLADWSGPSIDEPVFETAEIPAHLDKKELPELKSLTKLFKNSRQFFEKDGSKNLRERLEQMIDQPIESLLEQNRESAKDYYLSLYSKAEEQQRNFFENDCVKQIHAYQEQLTMAQDKQPEYESTLHNLETLLQTI